MSLSSKKNILRSYRMNMAIRIIYNLKRQYTSKFYGEKSFDDQPISWLVDGFEDGRKYSARAHPRLNLKEIFSASSVADLIKNITKRNLDIPEGEVEKFASVYNKFQADVERLKNLESEDEIEKLRISNSGLQRALTLFAIDLPNTLHPSSLQEERVLREAHETNTDKKSRSHVEIGEEHNLLHFSSVGPTAYYMKGQLAFLERQLSDVCCSYFRSQNFRLLKGPEFVKSPVLQGFGYNVRDTDRHLTLQQMFHHLHAPLLHLVGSSPEFFAAYASRRVVKTKCLPLHFYSCGPSYSTARSDLPGLYGSIQRTKVNLFSFVTEKDLEAHFTKTVDIIWRFLYSMGFPIRIVQIPAEALEKCETRRMNFQMYSPSLEQFITVGHVSDLGDYVSRRLLIFHHDNPSQHRNADTLHIVSSQALDLTALLSILMENNDTGPGEDFELPPLPRIIEYNLNLI